MFKSLTKYVVGRSVASKISAGFAIVLGLHISIVVLQHYSLEQGQDDLRRQGVLRSQMEVCHRIEGLVNSMQRNVLSFAFTGYEGPQVQVERLHTELKELLKSAANQDIDKSLSIDASVLKEMQGFLKTHEEIFEAVVIDRAKSKKIVDVDLAYCHDEFERLEDSIEQRIGLSKEIVAFDSAFRAAFYDIQQFVHNPDSSKVRRAKNHFSEARYLLKLSIDNSTSEPVEEVLELQSLVDQTEKLFIQMVQATRGYLHLVNVVLAGESAEFLRLASNTRRDFSIRAKRLSEEMAAHHATFTWASNIFSVVTILLGIIVSWLIGRDVAPPLNAITTTLDGLAKGQACKEIPGRNRPDELGRLAAAAQVFRDRAAETEKLLEEVTHMKDLERQLAHSSKLESIGQLAAGIAHEINTPMQCVATNVEYLEEEFEYLFQMMSQLEEMLPEGSEIQNTDQTGFGSLLQDRRFRMANKEIPASLEDASDAVNKIIEIVRAMKAMSHPGKVEHEPVDIIELVRSAAVISRNRWRYAAELKMNLDPHIPMPFGNAAELSQILLNLIVNAADAISEKFIDESEIGLIRIDAYATDQAIVIKVSDNGTGIPDSIKQKIFDPFFTTKDVGKGTGQGLAFAYQSIVRHKGVLKVESTPGMGTSFLVCLPIDENTELTEDAMVERGVSSS